MKRSMYQARALMEVWLADNGYSNGPIDLDAHCDDESNVAVYVSIEGGTTMFEFALPPGYPYDRYEVEQFFAAGKKTFSEL